MNSIKKERLPQLDIFRALAILGVLHVHATSFAAGEQALQSPYYVWINGVNIFFRFGTPCFIFLSSFVLFYNYYGRPVTRGLMLNFYRRRLTYILLPYLLASIGYHLMVLYINGQLLDDPLTNLSSFMYALITGSAYTHLYFVFISIQFYLVFPLILQLMQKSKTMVTWAIPIGLIIQWAFVFLNKYQLQLVDKASYAPTYMAYYMMGAYLAIHFDKIKPWLERPFKEWSNKQTGETLVLWGSWLAAAFIQIHLWYQGRHFGHWVNSLWYELLWNAHSMLSALVLLHATFLIYRTASCGVNAFMTRLGEISFAVYLLHPLILVLYRRFRYNIPLDSLAYVLFVHGGLIVALGVSWVVVQISFRQIRWSWIAFGSVPRSLAPQPKREPEAVLTLDNSHGKA
ncbi:acyltransferase [Paenibacillus sp. FSL M7-1046]|uniref:acyltransferase n=1 Tax=Paenibacillus sp. FSL M7-1046 TaxID=2975315 RepID=UPI0030FBD05D